MTETEYRGIDAENFSTVKEMRKSPAHYWWRRNHPREDTTGLKQGRANHTLIFQPDRWGEEYVTYPGETRRGKAWDEFEAAHEGKTILKANEVEECRSLVDAVLHHPLVSEFLAAGKAEEVLTWTDRLSGLTCKGRLDFRSTARPAILDLKGVPSVNPRILGAHAARQFWHGQAALYQDAAEANGHGHLPVYILAVEIEPPHDIGVFEVTEDSAMYAAREELRELMARIRECRERAEWPGRFEGIQPLELPGWAFPEDEGESWASLPVAAEG